MYDSIKKLFKSQGNQTSTEIKQKKKILIVEDEAIISGMYQHLLNNHGYDAYIAPNGEEGLRKVVELSPDLILLDIMMPVMSGKEMLYKLQSEEQYINYKNIPVIMLTNAGSIDNIRETKTLGSAIEFIIKSNSRPEEIVNMVDRYLH